MNKSIIAAMAAVIIVGGGATWYFVSRSNNNKPAETTTQQTTSGSTVSENTNTVNIQNMAFSPASITVKKGTTVTWTNNDSVDHTVTAGNNGFDSGLLSKGESFEFTFNTVGTFQYHCTVHPNMTGTVTVTE